MIGTVLGAVGFGYLVAGREGAAVALVAAVVGLGYPRSLALTAVCLLAVAAIATVAEAPLDRARIPTFGTDRDLAATTGRFAGVAALAAVLSMARRERAFRPRGPSGAARRGARTIPSPEIGGRDRNAPSRWIVSPWIVGAALSVPALALSTVGDASSAWMTTPLLGLAGVAVSATWVRRRQAMSVAARD
ncbi:MAG TPA: hypothetical protein VI916_15495 [Acidimicrobiia bacterium]|nr:hypothetical protein [Acidimicrobiia bacterium]